MAAFIGEALKGIAAELQTIHPLSARLRHLPKILSLLLKELSGIFSLIPYGVTTMQLYRSLPTRDQVSRGGAAAAARGVAVHRDVQYRQGERTVLDVYLPAAACAGGQYGEALPVVFFVHGGVWASGEKWHYAPMATRLSQEGFVVVVPTYDMYPKVLVPQMVQDVSDALTWCQDHISGYGGDPQRVAVIGHSAGGHLATLALMARVAAAAAAAATAAAAGEAAAAAAAAAAGPWSSWSALVAGAADTRLPALFVGLSAVYDITKHYEFETARGVQEMSMMKRAMGGPAGFAALSPSLVLRNSSSNSSSSSGAGHGPVAARGALEGLVGDAIPSRAGLGRTASTAGTAAVAAVLDRQYDSAEEPAIGNGNGNGNGNGSVSGDSSLPAPECWQGLPPVFVMSSCADHMVPWHEGAAFVDSLSGVGVPARHLIYNHVQHQDYVLAWKPLPQAPGGAGAGGKGFRDFQRDLVRLLDSMPRGAGARGGEREGERMQLQQQRARAVQAEQQRRGGALSSGGGLRRVAASARLPGRVSGAAARVAGVAVPGLAGMAHLSRM